MELIVTASLGKPRRSHHETAVGDGHFPSTNASGKGNKHQGQSVEDRAQEQCHRYRQPVHQVGKASIELRAADEHANDDRDDGHNANAAMSAGGR